ncbi:hypothetical protein STEG23_025146 [Scotinomys teguina]
MGQSVTTPLSLTLDHWKEVQEQAHNQSVEIRKKKWIALCSSEWPALDAGWPHIRTFDRTIISQVVDQVLSSGPHGHPDQVAYIVTWDNLAYDPPPWVAPFVSPSSKSIPQGPSALLAPAVALAPPPAAAAAVPLSPPSAPFLLTPITTGESHLYPVLRRDPPKSTPPKVLPSDDSVLIDLLTEDPPLYQAPVERDQVVRLEGEKNLRSPLHQQKTSPHPPRWQGDSRIKGKPPVPPEGASRLLPLRQMGGPNGPYQYWPFLPQISTTGRHITHLSPQILWP